jgi:hypothetical protein
MCLCALLDIESGECVAGEASVWVAFKVIRKAETGSVCARTTTAVTPHYSVCTGGRALAVLITSTRMAGEACRARTVGRTVYSLTGLQLLVMIHTGLFHFLLVYRS